MGQPMNISVVGTGYVGLVTGICFAEMGNHVQCVDIDKAKVDRLSRGEMTIFEPGLEALLERNTREGRLSFTTDLKEAIQASEMVLLALPTPPGQDGSADLSSVLTVAGQIGNWLNGYKVIINKSTVPVGTAERVKALIANLGAREGVDFDVVSNPEFLREGMAVEDFMKPDRVVIGTSSPRAAALMTSLYEPFVRNGNPILVMDERSAEMTKYACNSFLATKISFINEIANLCERAGANVDHVRRGMGSDTRIGKQFLYPGLGYGGSCFPKDVKALAQTAQEYELPLRILSAVMATNEQQRIVLLPHILRYFGGSLQGKHFAMWGLAFKANTDDVREASALAMIQELLNLGAQVTAYDPEAMRRTHEVIGNSISYAPTPYDALQDADALIVCTEWNEFRLPNFTDVKRLLKQPAIFDGRNLYDPKQMAELGFDYFSVGRPTFAPVTENLYKEMER